MRERTRTFAFIVVIALVVLVSTSPHPRASSFTGPGWRGADMGIGDFSFKRTQTADPNAEPIMTTQRLCMYCVPTSEQAWVDYFFIYHYGDYGHGRASGFTQDFYWNNDVNFRRTWSYVEDFPDSSSISCGDGLYGKRHSNISNDNGVDPYGLAWAMYARVGTYVGGYTFHEITYQDGPTATGWNTATHGLAWTLAQYHDPVGVIVDSGAHLVLATGAYTSDDPYATNNFWVSVSELRIRDPLRSELNNGNEVIYQTTVPDQADSWNLRLTRYGYNVTYNPTTESWATPPNHGADDPEVGPDTTRPAPGQFGFWWGGYVLIKRDDVQSTPDQHLSYAP